VRIIARLRKQHWMARLGMLSISIALIVGMVSCTGGVSVEYDLTMAANPAAGGTATDQTGDSPYGADTAVSMKAVAAANYKFVNWTAPAGTFASANAPETTFTMPAQDVTVTANFVLVYELTMAVSPAEGGTATDQTGTSPYAEGAEVSIEAVADVGYEFVNWSASAGTFANANAAETIFTMPAQDATVTANFEEYALTSISVESGLSIMNVPVDEASNIGYTVNFATELPEAYTIQFTQSCSPDYGGISLSTDYPPGWTSDTSQSWVVNEIIQGHIMGTYEITTRVVIVETEQSDEVTTIVRVISGEQIPILGPLGSDPDAVAISTATSVLFTAMLSGSNLTPTDIVVKEVDALGNPIATLGSIVDDGSSGDLQTGDNVYSGTFEISSNIEGVLYFKAVATFSGIPDPVCSTPCMVGVTDLPVEVHPSDMTKVVMDDTSGGEIISNEVLVSFEDGTELGTAESIVESIGGTIVGMIYGLGIFQVGIPDTGDSDGVYAAIAALLDYPEVDCAEPNGVDMTDEVTPNDSRYTDQWGPGKIRADETWVVARGSGITVAVVDTGVDYNHEDLSAKVIKGKDVADNDDDPMDMGSHGTHVAGIVGAQTNNGKGVAGIAWDSSILAVKIYKDTGGGATHAVLAAGIKYAADQGAKVINYSNSGTDSSTKHDAVKYATNKGALFVCAAGNAGSTTKEYPGAYAESFTVGNTGQTDNRAGTSNYGNWVNIAAPGSSILSTVPGNKYDYKSGTSMAAPHVAGAAAVVWAEHPSWTAAQVRERLERTAKPLPGLQLGAGRIDLFEAIFNGSFEIGDLGEWTRTGTASSFTSLGPLRPQDKNGHKNRMGYLSTGPSGDMVWSLLGQAFTIQPGITSLTISFDYNFVTEEYDEWVGTQYNDRLTISIETPGGGAITLAEEEINSSSFSWVTGIDFPGGDNTVGMTGWKSVSSTIAVTAGSADFRIYVTDAGDDIYDSVVLIDNVRFE